MFLVLLVAFWLCLPFISENVTENGVCGSLFKKKCVIGTISNRTYQMQTKKIGKHELFSIIEYSFVADGISKNTK